MTIDNSVVSTHLGKTSTYATDYSPSLLVRELRQNNRTHLNISDDNLPFVGVDIWNAYEITCLTNTGLPVNGVAKISYPCTTPYIVESKSLKLYLNSFNMMKFAYIDNKNVPRFDILEELITRDLNNLFGCGDVVRINIESTFDIDHDTMVRDKPCLGYTTIERAISVNDIQIDTYTEDETLLDLCPPKAGRHYPNLPVYLHTSTLFSRCRVTQQPDHGDVFMRMSFKTSTDPRPSYEGLLKYIASFRNECHFHEEICETIYERLARRYNLASLTVCCLYTRRGGIDINPIRASSVELIPSYAADVNTYHVKTAKQ